MLEAHQRLEEKKIMDEKEKVENKKLDAMLEVELAVHHWFSWTNKGRLLDKHGKLKLSKPAAVSIVKVLLPRIDATKKTLEYKTMEKCVDWLMSLADGTTWETEMEVVNKQYATAMLEAHPRLF